MKSALIRCAWACSWSILMAACSVAPRTFTVDDFASVEKIDIHVHINSTDSALIDQAKADHFRLLTINVDYPRTFHRSPISGESRRRMSQSIPRWCNTRPRFPCRGGMTRIGSSA